MLRISEFKGLLFPLGPVTENAVPNGKIARSIASPSVIATWACPVTSVAPLIL